MGDVLVGRIPLSVGAAVVTIRVIIVPFLLRGESGLFKAAALAADLTASPGAPPHNEPSAR